MKKALRIKKNEEFQSVFKKGKSFANRQFIIYVADRENETFRLGLSVGKKIGNAVIRNQVKRYIRQFFLEHGSSLQTGKDYVVIARMPAAKMDYHEVMSSLMHVCKVAKIYKLPKDQGKH